MQADEAYDPNGPLLDLSALTDACRISTVQAQIAERGQSLEELRAKLARLDVQQAEMNAYILTREKELDVLRAKNEHVERLTAAARAARVGLKAEHDRALASAAAVAARVGRR